MISKIKKPVSILLVFMMIVSLFAVVPITASAAEETSTVTWNSFTTSGRMSSGGVTLTTTQGNTRVGNNFYRGRGSATFTAPEGSVFTKIELKNCTVVDSLNFPGATVAQTGGYWQQEPWDDEPNWVQYYTVTWTGESSEVTFSGAIYGIQSIVFTLKSVAPAHTHDFTYAADGATITATCNGAGTCDITSGTTLTISAPTGDLTADGSKTFTATLSTGYNTTAFPGTYTIAYTKDGQPFDGTPTEAGNYTASVTVGTATASVSYTVAAPELFWKHSVTLGGDIGVNFYLNPAVIDTYTGAKTVTFSWDGNETTVDVPATATADGYKVTCNVVAAHMAHEIHAEVWLNGAKLEQTDDYSVQDYAETVYANPSAYDSEKPVQLKALAAAMLHYGSEAQTVFESSLNVKPDRADSNLDVAADYSGVTAGAVAAAIKGSASDLNTAAAAFDAEFYTSSLIYLQNNTLRLYFTPASKTVGALDGLDFSGNLSEYYYYVDKANIAAAKLDNQQKFSVGNTTFTFSALDYVKAVIESTKMNDTQKNLAKSLFQYNQAANAYFDRIIVLDDVTEDTVVMDGDTITGTLQGDYKISIDDGATVTLRDATITCLSNNQQTANFAGINPVGDATILLEGSNTVKGGHRRMPGIYIPANKTLTIDGTGSLEAYSGGDFSATSSSDSPASCGIGGKRNVSNGGAVAGGNLVINGGTITAYGGLGCAGIGSCTSNGTTSTKMFGDITINGGTVTASALDNAAGIGSGKGTPCGNITITGGTVTATGDGYAAGIGGGWNSNCGDITIAGTVTQVTATKGDSAPNSIGAGKDGTCGTVTIGGVEGAITESPYTYPAPAENIVDLSTLTAAYEAQDGDVLTGVLSGDKQITIAAGATVTLRGANITLSSSAQYAGITPLGDATIMLEGTNTVKGGYEDYPGIFVPANTTLTINGTGSLNASSHGYGCGIGGGFEKAAGNIVINGGTITANGGEWAAGIGSGSDSTCGNILITGGTITANGGEDAAGIGSGLESTCGDITITGGTITANGGRVSAGIGSGRSGNCGNITIADTVTKVTATKGDSAPNSIGAGKRGTCGTVTIEDNNKVTQN